MFAEAHAEAHRGQPGGETGVVDDCNPGLAHLISELAASECTCRTINSCALLGKVVFLWFHIIIERNPHRHLLMPAGLHEHAHREQRR